MRQHTARVSMQWSALLDALGELVSASHDERDADGDDKQLHDEAADVERAPSRKWLGRCDDSAPSSWNTPSPQHERDCCDSESATIVLLFRASGHTR